MDQGFGLLLLEELRRQQVKRDEEMEEERRRSFMAELSELVDDLHPYNVEASRLYRHFERRKTLAEMEAEHPMGSDWNAQFRFSRR